MGEDRESTESGIVGRGVQMAECRAAKVREEPYYWKHFTHFTDAAVANNPTLKPKEKTNEVKEIVGR